MDQKLTLNDGTILPNSYAIQNGLTLWIYIYASISFEQVFSLLGDAEKTARIVCDQYGTVNTYDSFTDFFCIRKEDGGFISAGLRLPNV